MLTRITTQLHSAIFPSFSTTLQILTRNKNSLHLQLSKAHRNYPIQQSKTTVTSSSHIKLLPYMHMNHEYLQSVRLSLIHDFKELDVFKNKLLPNQALANGQDFNEYPLMKIIQICLKYKKEGNQDQKLWARLESRVRQLFRNTSALQNILLFYISMGTFSPSFQSQLLKQIKQQYKSLTQLERQLLFYSLCHLKYSDSQLSPQLNVLKQEILTSIHKSKLSVGSLTQWIILIAIANASSLPLVLKYYDKVFLYDGGKYQLNVEQFYSLMCCLQVRAVLTQDYDLAKIRQKGRKVQDLYLDKTANSSMMLNTFPEHIRMKMILNYCKPTTENLLTNEQFLNSTFSNSEKLKYLNWVWKNDYIQTYELKSLYQSIEINELNHPTQQVGFTGIDIVYYVCLMELALGQWRNYGWVIARAANMEYIPQGLEWVLWNYLAYIAKNQTLLTTEQKNLVQTIIKRISSCSTTHDKAAKQAINIQNVKSTPQLQQLKKFFHSIKAWTFSTCEPVGGLDYIAHMINKQMKIILHCLGKGDFIEIKDHKIEDSQIQQKVVSNRHILDKKMLKDNFGYEVIDINIENFMSLNYGERVQWLRERIGETRVADKFIDK